MFTEPTYNGWTNYETWCVNLWLTNEEPTYRYWREQAGQHLRRAERRPDPHFTPRERAGIALADQLRDETGPDEDDLPTGLFRDLLGAALDSVNWSEVADSFLEDVESAE